MLGRVFTSITFAIALTMSTMTSSCVAHPKFTNDTASTGSSIALSLRVPHGDGVGTIKIILEMPDGTYKTKPRPIYGFDVNVYVTYAIAVPGYMITLYFS